MSTECLVVPPFPPLNKRGQRIKSVPSRSYRSVGHVLNLFPQNFIVRLSVCIYETVKEWTSYNFFFRISTCEVSVRSQRKRLEWKVVQEVVRVEYVCGRDGPVVGVNSVSHIKRTDLYRKGAKKIKVGGSTENE